MTSHRIVLVPGSPALLPQHASIDDPIPGLRTAVRDAVSWLAESGGPIMIRCDPRALRIAEYLVAEGGGRGLDQLTPLDQHAAVLVIGNGSACRTEKAPGFFDSRAEAFDEALGAALRQPDPGTLSGIDPVLSRELLADTDEIAWLGTTLTMEDRTVMTYEDDPYGVQYWVAHWELNR